MIFLRQESIFVKYTDTDKWEELVDEVNVK